jgi:SAM-dependent methyltransferase
VSAYDDELWETVPLDPGPPPAHLAAFVEALGPFGRALDLGCGDGRLSTRLRADELTAADVSAVALERARGRLGGARLERLEPDAPLPFADGSFDGVLCAETLEHVRDTQLLLSEVRRVLVPGGRLAVTTPAHGRLTGVRIALRGFERDFDPLSPHLRFYSRRSLARLLHAMGFAVDRLQTRAGTLLCVAGR